MGRTSDARLRLLLAAHDLIWSYSYGAITVEAICARASVRKGSFYHFFDSKSDLMQAAILRWWDERSQLIKEIFRPEVPPLERISAYIDYVTQIQIRAYEANGHVRGCPVFTLGSEICTQEDQVATLIREILRIVSGKFESAVFEAWKDGLISGTNPALKAKQLWAFYEGTLTKARIENDPSSLHTLRFDALELLGVQPIVLSSSAA
jgi:TetR/AcrR family transcriptional regulator, transcriptional repressor for nem operon